MAKIKDIFAREIKDSRGNPTVEVELALSDSRRVIASVASGASTGKTEALELRDADGKGVQVAIKNVNDILAPKLKGKNPENQKELDELMVKLDGTENKSKLGANAILAVSMAVCRAGASSKKIPLYQHIGEISNLKFQILNLRIPFAMFNIINGGRHAKNGLAIQEFMVIPKRKNFAENLVVCNKIFDNLKDLIVKNFGSEHIELGDEGGFAPPVATAAQALYLLQGASGSESEIKFGIDCAASEFYKEAKYILEGDEMTRAQMLDFYKELVKSFPLISIEDPFAQEDWAGFKEIREVLPQTIIIGDDLTTTNVKRIKEAHSKNACNGVILKLNQIGTVSETIEASNLAKSYNWKTIVSHRSGETMDNFITDLAVGLQADFLKAGSPAKPERMAKYERLLQIEQELIKISKHG